MDENLPQKELYMNSRILKHFVLFLAATFSFVQAQNILINGTVKGENSTVLSNAIVTLKGQNLKDTTDSDGKYEIIKQTVTINNPAVTQPNSIQVSNNVLTFYQVKTQKVSLELFDLKGKRIEQLYAGLLRKGKHSFTLHNNHIAHQVFFIQINANSGSSLYKIINVNKANYRNTVTDIQEQSNIISMISVIEDTLIATHEEYISATLPITSYDSTYDFSLELKHVCNWTWTPITDGPRGTTGHGAVWMAGYGPNRGKMAILGGSPNPGENGGMYDPDAGDWEWTDGCNEGDPVEAVWAGDHIFMWGPGYYNPEEKDCRALPSTPEIPSAKTGFSVIWDDVRGEMIVWGGQTNSSPTYTNYGARYKPGSPQPYQGNWTATSQGDSCPGARAKHGAVWTGSKMIVWGGGASGTNSGGVYDPANNSWTATSESGDCPSRRTFMRRSVVWAGSIENGSSVNKMFVWGGAGTLSPKDDGAMYNPQDNSWTTISNVGSPSARTNHSTIWDNVHGEVIVWGGVGDDAFNDGAHYNPKTDSWRPTETLNAPEPRRDHTTIWTGQEMIIWSGTDGDETFGNGAIYKCVSE